MGVRPAHRARRKEPRRRGRCEDRGRPGSGERGILRDSESRSCRPRNARRQPNRCPRRTSSHRPRTRRGRPQRWPSSPSVTRCWRASPAQPQNSSAIHRRTTRPRPPFDPRSPRRPRRRRRQTQPPASGRMRGPDPRPLASSLPHPSSATPPPSRGVRPRRSRRRPRRCPRTPGLSLRLVTARLSVSIESTSRRHSIARSSRF